MPETYPPTNPAEVLIKEHLWDLLVQTGLASFFAHNPGLSVWPVKNVIVFVVKQFSNKLYDALRLAVDLAAITFINNEHKKAFDRAAVVLKIIAHDKGIDSEEFRKAKDEAKLALARFVKFAT